MSTTTSELPVTDAPDAPPTSGAPDAPSAISETPAGVEPDAATPTPFAGANEVRLVGRVSGISEPHELPSGDSVVTLRLVVPREVHRARQPSVDTIDVACWSPETQQGAADVGVGGIAEVTGSMRRRFFRGGGGLQSRYEVEAHSVCRPASNETD